MPKLQENEGFLFSETNLALISGKFWQKFRGNRKIWIVMMPKIQICKKEVWLFFIYMFAMQTVSYSYTIFACGCVSVFDTTYIRGGKKKVFSRIIFMKSNWWKFKVTLVVANKCLYLCLSDKRQIHPSANNIIL